MKAFHLKKTKKNKIGPPLFTGTIVRQSPLAGIEKADVSVDYVHFPKGVRNKFHKHSNDQVLIVTKGSGTIATKNKKFKVHVGDIIWIPAGEVHWHGASKSFNFTHISVTKAHTTIKQIEK